MRVVAYMIGPDGHRLEAGSIDSPPGMVPTKIRLPFRVGRKEYVVHIELVREDEEA